jgi:hypothetical protein
MDIDKWRIKKKGQVWCLYAPGYRVLTRAQGSWLYCATRLIYLQRANAFETSSRWRDG